MDSDNTALCRRLKIRTMSANPPQVAIDLGPLNNAAVPTPSAYPEYPEDCPPAKVETVPTTCPPTQSGSKASARIVASTDLDIRGPLLREPGSSSAAMHVSLRFSRDEEKL